MGNAPGTGQTWTGRLEESCMAVGGGWLRVVAGCLLGLVAAGCGELPRPQQQRGEGPGHREQPLALSPRQELAVGRRAYQQVMEEVRDRVLPDSHPQVQRARRVMNRLVKASEIEPLQREVNLRVRGYRFEWETNVIRDRQV